MPGDPMFDDLTAEQADAYTRYLTIALMALITYLVFYHDRLFPEETEEDGADFSDRW
jgi:hypothetical protein